MNRISGKWEIEITALSRVVVLVFLVFHLASSTPGLSRDRSLRDFRHTAWTAKDGAPSQISALAQTTDGYLWIGSTSGLFRFDGVEFDQTGVFLGMREAVRSMRKQGSGSIINISSIWGSSAAVAGAHSYHAAKGAVRNMSKNAAVTYVGDGIRVNSIHPGFIDTPLTKAQAPELNKLVIDSTPMKRAGTPLEIAYGCLYLASDESSYVTGTELVIDGGYLAQ